MTQPNADDTERSTCIEVDCPHEEVIGPHKLTLDKPIIDNSIGFDQLCARRYRVKAGPPPAVEKVS